MKRLVMMMALLVLAPGFSWAQHNHGGGGHSGHGGGSSSGSHWEEDNSYERIQKVEKKKLKIEARLRDPNLKPAKRAKLEQKLEKLRLQH